MYKINIDVIHNTILLHFVEQGLPADFEEFCDFRSVKPALFECFKYDLFFSLGTYLPDVPF